MKTEIITFSNLAVKKRNTNGRLLIAAVLSIDMVNVSKEITSKGRSANGLV